MNNYQGENYKLWNSEYMEIEAFNKLENQERLKFLCLAGHLAASTHNTQPWRFQLHLADQSITIKVDNHYILPASDVDGRQTIISVGCALKNIQVAANYLGFETEIDIIENDKSKFKPSNTRSVIPIIKINLKKATPNLDLKNLYKSIFVRQVTRAEYDEQTNIPEQLLTKFNSLTDESIKVHLVSDRIRRLTIGEFQGQADNFVINSTKFSRELGDWLLPNNTENYVGMPGITFGLNDEESLRLHEGLQGKIALKPEDGLKFSTGGKMGIEKSPTICFLTCEKDEIINWISAGQIMEEIFLELSAVGAAFTVHAGIAEVSLINKFFSMSFLGTSRRIVTLFRMGFVKKEEDKKRPHSPRQPLEEIIID